MTSVLNRTLAEKGEVVDAMMGTGVGFGNGSAPGLDSCRWFSAVFGDSAITTRDPPIRVAFIIP